MTQERVDIATYRSKEQENTKKREEKYIRGCLVACEWRVLKTIEFMNTNPASFYRLLARHPELASELAVHKKLLRTKFRGKK